MGVLNSVVSSAACKAVAERLDSSILSTPTKRNKMKYFCTYCGQGGYCKCLTDTITEKVVEMVTGSIYHFYDLQKLELA
jgi:hypothetical protein